MANLKCTYYILHFSATTIQGRQLFKGDNYSREETIDLLDFFSATSIQGRKLLIHWTFLARQVFKGDNYSREETIRGNTVHTCLYT